MMKKSFYLIFTLFLVNALFNKEIEAQVSINLTGDDPDPSAMLDVSSSSGGLLVPRMTKTEREAINDGEFATGLLIYQTDNSPGYYYFNGLNWERIVGGDNHGWTVDGSNMYSNNSGSVGVGTDNPSGNMEISNAGSSTYLATDLRISLYSDGSNSRPRITYLRSHSPTQGDVTSAQAVTLDGDILGQFVFGGIRVNGTGGSNSGAGWFEMVQKGSTSEFGVPGQFQIITANGLGNRDTRFVVSPEGNVGIGTENPTEKLDVEGDINMNKNEVKNMVIENRTSDPSNPAVGQIWYRTDL